MEPFESLSPIYLPRIDVEYLLSENFLSMSTSYFWDCLTKSGEVDFPILPTFGLKLRPQGGAVTIVPIRSA